jgi:hypothetical protein
MGCPHAKHFGFIEMKQVFLYFSGKTSVVNLACAKATHLSKDKKVI